MRDDFTVDDILGAGQPSQPFKQLAIEAHHAAKSAKQAEEQDAFLDLAYDTRLFLMEEWDLPEPMVTDIQFRPDGKHAIFKIEDLVFRSFIMHGWTNGQATEELVIEYQKGPNVWPRVKTLADVGGYLA